MFRALKRLLGGPSDPSQLALPLDAPSPPPRSADELLTRLRELGLGRITSCHLTRNRNVMVSFRGTDLRVHEGYLAAPVEVLQAIVAFVEGRKRAERHAAQRIIVSFPVARSREARRGERQRPEDAPVVARLTESHVRYNVVHFDGRLRTVPVRISRRMKTRLGHYTAATSTDNAEIAIGWRHLRRHGWDEALHTLLHEMVHQWQDENGHAIDHGPRFRRKAREVGIAPRASRAAPPRPLDSRRG